MIVTESPRVRIVEEMERLIGEGDWDGAARHFTSDAVYRVGSLPARHGIDGIRAHMEDQGRLVRWVGHTPHLTIDEGDTVVIEVASHFLRLRDQQRVTVPCTDIYRFSGDRIRDWRVYADMSPFAG